MIKNREESIEFVEDELTKEEKEQLSQIGKNAERYFVIRDSIEDIKSNRVEDNE